MTWNTHGNQDRRRRKMDRIDALSPALRKCVHEHGWNVVKSFIERGISDAATIDILTRIIKHETTAYKLDMENSA